MIIKKIIAMPHPGSVIDGAIKELIELSVNNGGVEVLTIINGVKMRICSRDDEKDLKAYFDNAMYHAWEE